METTTNKITVFDTTLRDGEQGPGKAISRGSKLLIAEKLNEMKVDVIEAGYASSSPEKFAAIREISKEIRHPIICSLAMCRDDSIETAANALANAKRSRIHLYLGSSQKHRNARGMSQQQYIDTVAAGVRKAKQYFSDIQFSPEDGARTEIDFLTQIADAVRAEGATTFNVPDTVGYATPKKMRALFRSLYENIQAVRDGTLVLSTHNHNDQGRALENTLAAVEGGARQIEGTIMGIGERTGNADLITAIIALQLHAEESESPFGVPDVLHINTQAIYSTAKLIEVETHQGISDKHPFVGRDAYITESGTHVDLIQKDPTTYYPVPPELIGRGQPVIAIGSNSGKKALFPALSSMGYEIPDDQRQSFFDFFKRYADGKLDQGGAVSAEELHTLIYEFFAFAIPIEESPERRFLSTRSDGAQKKAVMVVKTWTGRNRSKRTEREWTNYSHQQQGVFQAAASLIRQQTKIDFTVVDEQQKSVESGEDSQSLATVRIKYAGKIYTGTATDTDLVESTVRALLDAVNQVFLPIKRT